MLRVLLGVAGVLVALVVYGSLRPAPSQGPQSPPPVTTVEPPPKIEGPPPAAVPAIPAPVGPAPSEPRAQAGTLIVEPTFSRSPTNVLHFNYAVTHRVSGAERTTRSLGAVPGPDGTLRVSLPGGTTRVTVSGWAGGYAFAQHDLQLASLPGGETRTAAFRFSGYGRAVSGRVRVDGGPYWPATMRITPVDSNQEARGPTLHVHADLSGRFAFGGIDRGAYRVRVLASDPSTPGRYSRVELQLPGGTAELTFTVPRPRN